MTDPEPAPPRRPRRGFWSRLAHDVGWVSKASETGTRIQRDAVHQYDEEADSGPGPLGRLPGWVLIAVLIAIVVFVVLFTGSG